MKWKIFLAVLVAIVLYCMLLLYRKESVPKPVVEEQKMNKTPAVVSVTEFESAPVTVSDSKYKWRLFLGSHRKDDIQSEVFQITESTKTDAHEQYLKSIDSNFRESISRSVPIHCHSGEYGLFPKKYRKFIDLLVEYSHFHKHQPTTRVLVWECTRERFCGGFGDRLRGITFSLVLAMFSGRKLFINWNSDNTIRYLEPNFINWRSNKLKNKMVAPLRIFSIGREHVEKKKFVDVKRNVWQGYLTWMNGVSPYIKVHTNLELYTLTLKDSTNGQKWLKEAITKAGFNDLSSYDIDKLEGFVFRYLFKVDPMIFKEVESAMRVLQINNTPFLGLHLRTGFVGSKFAEVHKNYKIIQNISKWMDAFECAVNQADTHIGNNSLIYFATDSSKAKEMAINRFGLRFRSLDMELTHIEKSNNDKGIMSMLVDIFILSQSYVLIRGLSGFSFISESICNIPTYHGENYCKN